MTTYGSQSGGPREMKTAQVVVAQNNACGAKKISRIAAPMALPDSQGAPDPKQPTGPVVKPLNNAVPTRQDNDSMTALNGLVQMLLALGLSEAVVAVQERKHAIAETLEVAPSLRALLDCCNQLPLIPKAQCPRVTTIDDKEKQAMPLIRSILSCPEYLPRHVLKALNESISVRDSANDLMVSTGPVTPVRPSHQSDTPNSANGAPRSPWIAGQAYPRHKAPFSRPSAVALALDTAGNAVQSPPAAASDSGNRFNDESAHNEPATINSTQPWQRASSLNGKPLPYQLLQEPVKKDMTWPLDGPPPAGCLFPETIKPPQLTLLSRCRRSDLYVPKVSSNITGVPDPFDPTDEYRDDDDPGHRIRELWEAELVEEIRSRARGDDTIAWRIPFVAAFTPGGLPSEHGLGSSVSGNSAAGELNISGQSPDYSDLSMINTETNPAGFAGSSNMSSCSSQGPRTSTLSSQSSPRIINATPPPGLAAGANPTRSNPASQRSDSARQSPTFGSAPDPFHKTTNAERLNTVSKSDLRPASPSFGTGEGDQASPVSPAFGRLADPDVKENAASPVASPAQRGCAAVSGDDELTMCGGGTSPSNFPSRSSTANIDPPDNVEDTASMRASAVPTEFAVPHSLTTIDAYRWQEAYNDGNIEAHRRKKILAKQAIISSLVYPPSPHPDFPTLDDQNRILDCFNLRIVFERLRTGFEDTREFSPQLGTSIAGRYIVERQLGQAAFSKALQCFDMKTKERVCMKVIRNEKDYVDQSLDEIKLLRFINANADVDMVHCLKMLDYFYYKEHLIIVTELLQSNLYEFAKKQRETNQPYFTLGCVQRVAYQILVALKYIHSLGLLHADLKPENILIKDPAIGAVKVIDFGSSCFEDDRLPLYLQSRSYRAPEVLLGLPYDRKIDIWSAGCILAELWTGYVLFQNNSVAALLARVVGIIGQIPYYMVARGQTVSDTFTQDGQLFLIHTDQPACPRRGKRTRLLLPKPSSLKQRLRTNDEVFIDFLTQLLQIDPTKRPSAEAALAHPWLQAGRYPDGLQ